MHMLNLGSFLYADDLILIGVPSLYELQAVVNICCDEFGQIELFLNVNKSACMRIGKQFHQTCKSIKTLQGPVPWFTYLGVEIVSAVKYTCSFHK